MLRYSLDHLCQKCLTKVWHSCQRRKREREGWARDVSRMELRGLPMRKCPGVRASMPSSPADSRGVRGRLFKHASTCVRMVENSSNVSLVLPITFFRCILALLTATYHKPPKCGDRSGMNFHSILLGTQKLEMSPCVFLLLRNHGILQALCWLQ